MPVMLRHSVRIVFFTALALGLFTLTLRPTQARDIEAGPLWNNDHARAVCPAICERRKLTWRGQWRTTVFGVMSVCGCEGKQPRLPARMAGWVKCAEEGGVCEPPYRTTIAYGSGGSFAIKPVRRALACTNEVFGDPVPGVRKACYYKPRSAALPGEIDDPTPSVEVQKQPAPRPGSWVRCARENQLCRLPYPTTIRYGADGDYFTRKAQGDIPCTNDVFMDPVPGTVKACWYRAR